VGLFDESLVRNQDIELNGRIRSAGGRVVLSPLIRSTYFCRNSLLGLWKQNYRNGLWLLRTALKTPKSLSVRHFIPLAFICALLLGLVIALTFKGGWILLALVAGSYLLASSAASLLAAFYQGWRFALTLPVVFSVLHISYGVGTLVGLCSELVRGLERRFFPRPSLRSSIG
jgi:hypothetical protein